MSFATPGLASKRLVLLLELRPGARLVGYLDNSRLSAAFETNVASLTTAASTKGREFLVFDAATEQEVETAFTDMALHRVRTLVVSPDAFLNSRQEQIIARILNGAEPGESPVMLPTRFELVINDRTAKALRIAVPRRLLSRGGETID
jgi:putative tryptophan/tyrosine transport system substrate-binding protein